MPRLMILMTLVLANSAVARDFAGYFMQPDEELRLAATAGPASVTADASYYTLTSQGFELAVAGSNQWHCFVERAFFARTADANAYDTRIRAPHCINEAGAKSRMQEVFMRTRLALEGLDQETIATRVNAAYESGALRLPEGLAMTYMMSTEQYLGADAGAWHPHLMFWVPYLENDDVGGNAEMGRLPFVAPGSGTRSAVLIVAVEPLADDG
ncbi:MAG: hypothetical protein R3358_08490 [Woeseiaceae bacterium]|nr:hypothetical protein [Woeseiaceae bacterium]